MAAANVDTAGAHVERSTADEIVAEKTANDGTAVMESTVTYQPACPAYRKLKDGEIRVLRLSPGTFEKQIRGHFEVRQLGERAARTQPYIAISYAWGAPDLPETVILGDDASLAITTSLHGALRALRDPHMEIRVWADAVCINQSDLTERSKQVARMFDVYAQAVHTVIWLGESTPSDADIFLVIRDAAKDEHLMDHLYEKDEHLVDHFQQLTPDRFYQMSGPTSRLKLLGRDWKATCICTTECQHGAKCPKTRGYGYACGGKHTVACVVHTMATLHGLVGRPWFARLWVVQEIQASFSVFFQCGPHRATFHEFEEVLDYMSRCVTEDPQLKAAGAQRYQKRLTRTLSDLRAFGQQAWQYGAESPTVDRLVALSSRSCTEPHDRVYAALRFIGLAANPLLAPDYSLPREQLFALFTRVLLETTYRSDAGVTSYHGSVLFSMATAYRIHDRMATLPSWVIDYHHMDPRSLIETRRYFDDCPDGCYRSAPQRFEFRYSLLEPFTIEIKSCRFARVAQLPSPLSQRLSSDDGMDGHDVARESWSKFWQWYWHCRTQLDFLTGRPANSAELKGLIDPTAWAESSDGGLEDAGHAWLDYLSGLLATHRPAAVLQQKRLQTQLLSYFRRNNICMKDSYPELSLCYVSSSNCGMKLARVPRATRLGDLLCYFSGGPFPFVVRENESGGTYTLVGEAWIVEHNEWQAMGIGETQWDEMIHDVKLQRQAEGLDISASQVKALQRWKFTVFSSRDLWDARRTLDEALVAWEKENLGWIPLS